MNVNVKPTVKMRAAKTGSAGGGKAYMLTVPSELARVIEKAGIDTFEVDVTEEGIVYRPVDSVPDPVIEVPEWLKKGAEAVVEEDEAAIDALASKAGAKKV